MLTSAGNYESRSRLITGETRGKCTKVLDRAYLSILFSPVSAQIMRQGAVYIFLPDNLFLIKNGIVRANVDLTTNFIHLISLFKLSLGQENILNVDIEYK